MYIHVCGNMTLYNMYTNMNMCAIATIFVLHGVISQHFCVNIVIYGHARNRINLKRTQKV